MTLNGLLNRRRHFTEGYFKQITNTFFLSYKLNKTFLKKLPTRWYSFGTYKYPYHSIYIETLANDNNCNHRYFALFENILLRNRILHLQFQKLSHYFIFIKNPTIIDKIFGTK